MTPINMALLCALVASLWIELRVLKRTFIQQWVMGQTMLAIQQLLEEVTQLKLGMLQIYARLPNGEAPELVKLQSRWLDATTQFHNRLVEINQRADEAQAMSMFQWLFGGRNDRK